MECLSAGQANAVVVSVGGQYWDVTTFTGSYNDHKSKFNTAANGGVMPWWPDTGGWGASIAFAGALGDKLGYPNVFNYGAFTFTTGPAFSYGFHDSSNVANDKFYVKAIVYDKTINGLLDYNFFDKTNHHVTWAQATPVPAPLPMMSVAAALYCSRKIRKRIRSSKF